MRNIKRLSAKHKEPTLFEIPNPFDDFQREKKGWYIETQKLEQIIKSLRERIETISQRQKEQRAITREILDYSNDVKNKRSKRSYPYNF